MLMLPPEQDYIKIISELLKEMEDELPLGLRGWKQHAGYTGRQDEVPITQELCRRLTTRHLMSKGQRYPQSRKSCDIVSILTQTATVWIEAKIYWTVYFDDKDTDRTKPKLASASQTWQARVEALVSDCSTKLLQLLPPATPVAGLLLGFERKDHPSFSYLNPSTETIDEFLQSQINQYLPGWNIYDLSNNGGWCKPDSCRPEFTLLTRPMLLLPGSTT